MINLFFFLILILAAIASWKIVQNYQEKEAELIREYLELKRKHGLK